MNTDWTDDQAPFVSHDEFRDGLPRGQFRVVIDPTRARPYIVQRTWSNAVAFSAICLGAALALSGQGLAGLALVGVGIGANRLVRRHAPAIVLHLAARDPQVYAEVTAHGVLEVRRTVA